MALTVSHVSKSFGEKKAVDDLSFEISKPQVFGLLGTNGAGKTTSIRIILGIMESDEGEIHWNGKKVSRDTVSFGYMPEERGIYPKVQVLEQVVYFGRLHGMSRHDALRSAKSWMERLGVTEYSSMQAEKLSKGNQQKIQLIAALIHDPELIFMDEPFNGLDPINADVFKSVILDLVKGQHTIVMSGHQMSTMEQYCSDLLILDKGHTKLQGNLRSIKAGYGHTNLSIGCDQSELDKVVTVSEKYGLHLLERKPDSCEFKIDGDEAAQSLLRDLIESGLFPYKYEIREPSLHEIFIEKVGVAK